MKNHKFIPFLASTFFCLFFICCNEDEPPIDPQQTILGKWKIIENSFGPVSYPGSYTEYRPDSIVFDYVSEADTSYSKYWFSDSLLFVSHIYIDQITNDTIIVDTQSYKFQFLSYNKLRLDLQQPAIVTKFIYERLK